MMSDEELPEEVKDLVRRYVHSVTQLEALLFFHERAGGRWEVEALAARLYAREAEVSDALVSLTRDGFLEGGAGVYAFAPQGELRSVVDSLAKAYSRHLIAIIQINTASRAASRNSPTPSGVERTRDNRGDL